MRATPPSLTFVAFVHNGGAHLTPALQSVCEAIERAQWPDARVLVVDDGSTDDTAAQVRAFADTTDVDVRVVSQPHSGRLVACRTGVEQSETELVAFLGVRVRMHPDSLANLADEMTRHPERRVWNCHIEVPREHNPQAQFWHVMTFVGWRRYLRQPRLVSFGSDDFDHYPKGTGGFVAPRELLLEGYASLSSIYDDARFTSDDTALIRLIATRERIWMTPRYAADYLARDDMSSFARHTFDRGTLFLDSYLHPGTRLFWPLIAFFVATPVLGALAVRRPRLLLALPGVSAAAAGGLLAVGAEPRDVRGFSLLAPPFGVLFGAGLWRGLFMMAAAALRREPRR